jgi:hypothetical protein
MKPDILQPYVNVKDGFQRAFNCPSGRRPVKEKIITNQSGSIRI